MAPRSSVAERLMHVLMSGIFMCLFVQRCASSVEASSVFVIDPVERLTEASVQAARALHAPTLTGWDLYGNGEKEQMYTSTVAALGGKAIRLLAELPAPADTVYSVLAQYLKPTTESCRPDERVLSLDSYQVKGFGTIYTCKRRIKLPMPFSDRLLCNDFVALPKEYSLFNLPRKGDDNSSDCQTLRLKAGMFLFTCKVMPQSSQSCVVDLIQHVGLNVPLPESLVVREMAEACRQVMADLKTDVKKLLGASSIEENAVKHGARVLEV